MRKLLLILSIVIFVTSCKKDKDCVSNIEDDIILDIHYNRINGCLVNQNNIYELVFENFENFENFNCYPSSIPVELGFDGIIIVSGYQVPYAGIDAYDKFVKIKKDICNKIIDFKFIMETIDTSDYLENNENVIVLLNGVDSTYTVNFSHEIIPFKD